MRCAFILVAICAAVYLNLMNISDASAQTLPSEPRRVPHTVTQTLTVFAFASAPMLRPFINLAPYGPPTIQKTGGDAGFKHWVRNFRHCAAAQGIWAQTFDRAFRGARYDPDVIRRDRNQSEFTKTIWDYLDSAVSGPRIKNGKAALRKHRIKLNAIEARYGVDKEVVVAIWGLESAYGSFKGDNNVVQSLATLAFDGRRGRFFEAQLIAALKILQNGDTSPRNMTGSWAGAMGLRNSFQRRTWPTPWTSTVMVNVTFGLLTRPMRWPRLQLTSRVLGGSKTNPGVSKSTCRMALIMRLPTAISATARVSGPNWVWLVRMENLCQTMGWPRSFCPPADRALLL